MLERSGDIPLHVQPIIPGWQCKFDKDAIQLILSQAYRIYYLDILVRDEVSDALSSFQLPLQLPICEHLSVYRGPRRADTVPFVAPVLQRIKSGKYSFEGVSPALSPSIRSLDVSLYNIPGSEHLGNILEHLRNMTLLEEIVIFNCQLSNHERLYSLKPLLLTHLRALKISLDTPNLEFLTRLSCPPGLHLDLSIACNQLNAEIFTDMLKHPLAVCGIGRKEGARVQGIELCAAMIWLFSLRCWTHPPSEPFTMFPSKSDLPRLELSIDLEEALIVDVAPLCRAISRMFDLSALDTLVLRGTSLNSFLEDLKHEKFSPMHNVRKIVAWDWHWAVLETFLTHTHTRPQTESNNALPEIAFPRLECLDLLSISKPSQNNHKGPPFSSRIQRILDFRKAHGSVISKLHIHRSCLHYVPQEDCEKLVQLPGTTTIILY